mmetsp:Transcript_19076/g.26781  ORF Transcript_19076/g.26781 Transcript_19076/m.26781 type:complete len:179 (-) Transcript_19076:268-804(-)|eukprot:CAMPEP_0175101828 /NCGR_PEP_ID=MMETSP0086_2-20121207/8055_1 /TAXON_ID=136419 /ORGANISM="Unknown Unknown, Strain D1" /LENGTH=178 /DNA_ID=CAMNT_0016376485 /DNA_START=38 /DNA_END=574 /DNA_ORIENTATION=+
MPPSSEQSNREVLENIAYRVVCAARDQTQWEAGGKIIEKPETHDDKVYNAKVEVWRRMTSLHCLKPILHFKACVDKGERDCERANDMVDLCLHTRANNFEIFSSRWPILLGETPGCGTEYRNLNYAIQRTGSVDQGLFNDFRKCITHEHSPGSSFSFPLPNVNNSNNHVPYPEHQTNH